MLDGVFKEQWEKERQEYIKKLGSKEYGCEVDYTCGKIDSMRDTIKDYLVGQVALGNEGVLDSLLNNLEGLRKSITELRDWGHDLRYLLLKNETRTKDKLKELGKGLSSLEAKIFKSESDERQIEFHKNNIAFILWLSGTDAETESVFEKVRAIHGDKYTYERREGTEVDLTELDPNQRVCAGGTGWHVLMTKKA